jgi:hypothetical protein
MSSSVEAQTTGDAIAIAGILGRIEANLGNVSDSVKELTSGMKEIDARLRLVETAVAQQPDGDRIRKLETTVEALVATKPVRAPWWSIVGGIAALGGIITGAIYLINAAVTIGA